MQDPTLTSTDSLPTENALPPAVHFHLPDSIETTPITTFEPKASTADGSPEASADLAVEGSSAVITQIGNELILPESTPTTQATASEETTPATPTATTTTAITASITDAELKEQERLAEIVYAHVTPEEAKVLQQFCAKMAHLKENPLAHRFVHPYTLIRFLRARNGDLAKASQMFEESMRWRTQENIDERVAQWNLEVQQNVTPRAQLVTKFWFMAPMGKDSRGVSVLVSRVGRADPGGLERECGWEAFLLQHVSVAEYQVEEARRRTLETGKLVLAFVAIYDMAGGSVPKWTARAWSSVDPFRRLAPILDSHYPERLARAFIVNVPWVFKTFWSIFTPIIPKATLEKISLYRTAWLTDMTTGPHCWLSHDQIPHDLLLDGAAIPSHVEAKVTPSGGIVTRGAITSLQT